MRWNPFKSKSAESVIDIPTSDARALAGGRLTVDKAADSYFGSAVTVLSPQHPEDEWRRFSLDSQTLDRITPSKLLSLLTDLSPDVSRALWDLLRLGNPGWEITVTRPNSDTKYKRGQDAVNDFLEVLENYYGSVDIVFNALPFAGFLRGAMLAELVLDKRGRMPVDLVTPDPWCVRFKRETDAARGPIWQPGQYQRGQWVAFTRPTIRYAPIDPAPGCPYGRPMASPALFSTLFLLGLLHDLRRVIAQQGYPRLHISLDLEKLMASMPQQIKTDPRKSKEWIEAISSEVQKEYAKLRPDDAFVSTDIIDIKSPVGTLDMKSLGAVEGVIRALERMSVRALKTMPLLMGSNEAVSETHANRQWEIHVAGVKSLQHLSETMLGRLFGLALQAQGIAARVTVRFAELRAAEELRDQQVIALKLDNASKAYNLGYISQDEAAMMGLGREKADQPEPRTGASDSDAPDANANIDPGASRRPRLVTGGQ